MGGGGDADDELISRLYSLSQRKNSIIHGNAKSNPTDRKSVESDLGAQNLNMDDGMADESAGKAKRFDLASRTESKGGSVVTLEDIP